MNGRNVGGVYFREDLFYRCQVNSRVASRRKTAATRPRVESRVEDDVGDRVVMASSWLLPSKVAVVDRGSFVDPTTITGSPCVT